MKSLRLPPCFLGDGFTTAGRPAGGVAATGLGGTALTPR